MRRTLATVSLPLALASAAAAQQFVPAPGGLPGPARWSSAVRPADVDGDGDLDLLVADGEGAAAPGAKRQNVLLVNGLETAPGTWSDESVARLGVHESHARDVLAGDLDGDGWIDAVFANGFRTDPPFVYRNRGASAPGTFDLDAAAGLVEPLASEGGALGDVDDDGDLDLVLTDSGPQQLGGAGGRARLYRNGGAGTFVEDAAALGAPLAASQRDVELADLDGDLDLDVLVSCRASGGPSHLLLNDGACVFSDASALLPALVGDVEEVEAVELTFDGDADLFALQAASGQAEAVAENRLVPAGALSFQLKAPLSGAGDDRDAALLDYDGNDALDAFLARQDGANVVFRNDFALSFSLASGVLPTAAEPTLDLAVADLDGDGDRDLVAAQGEGAGPWDNRVYVNQGSADVRAPRVLAADELDGADPAGPWALRLALRDDAWDDGENGVRGEVRWRVETSPQEFVVDMFDFGFSPQLLTVPAGAKVTFRNVGFALHDADGATPGAEWDGPLLQNGESWTTTFVTPGTYDYFCSVHPWMVGQIVVTGAPPQSAPARPVGGGRLRFEMSDTAGGAGVALAYELRVSDPAGNELVLPGAYVPLGTPCGTSPYGDGLSSVHTIVLSGAGSTQLGGTFEAVSQGVPSAGAFTAIALQPASVPLWGGTLLVDLGQLVLVGFAPAAGGVATWSQPIPANPALAYLPVYLQAAAEDASQPAGWTLSNGLELVLCP